MRGRTSPTKIGIATVILATAAFLWHRDSSQLEPIHGTADRIVVEKSSHTMTLFSGATQLRRYKVALGRGTGKAKQQQGDHETPEGIYTIDAKNEHSHFYRAMHVSYPNMQDKRRAQAAALNPGGDIMIHGIKNGLGWIGNLSNQIDWTDGCIALTDKEMDSIWAAVPVGTIVEINH